MKKKLEEIKMKECGLCGDEYPVLFLLLDSGLCQDCRHDY